MVHVCNPSSFGEEKGESQSEADLGKSTILYLKNKLHQKGLRAWLK
jgi:hypothetical protein